MHSRTGRPSPQRDVMNALNRQTSRAASRSRASRRARNHPAAGRPSGRAARRADPDDVNVQALTVEAAPRASGNTSIHAAMLDPHNGGGAVRKNPRARRPSAEAHGELVRPFASAPGRPAFPASDNGDVQYVLSELDSGERVISERIPSVRSGRSASGSGAGSRTKPTPGRHLALIEHLLFKGSRLLHRSADRRDLRRPRRELNAATRASTTMVTHACPTHTCRRAPRDDGHGFAPAFTDLDSERRVVLEEIAMYENTPQELVHDLFSEAVFGHQCAGASRDGTADVISSVTKRVLSTPPPDVRRRQRRIAAAGNVSTTIPSHASARTGRSGHPRRSARETPLVKAPPPGFRSREDTEQYHVCLGAPGIARSDRAASRRRSRFDSGGSASSRLFQEIRRSAAMAYSVDSSHPVHGHGLGYLLGTRERTSAMRRDRERAAADIAAESFAGKIARAKGEPEGALCSRWSRRSNRMTSSASRSSRTRSFSRSSGSREIEAVEPDEVAELAGSCSPQKLSISGIGPPSGSFEPPRAGSIRPSRPRCMNIREKMRAFSAGRVSTFAPLVDEDHLNGRPRQGRARPRAGAGKRRHELATRRGRRHDRLHGPDAVEANVRAAPSGDPQRDRDDGSTKRAWTRRARAGGRMLSRTELRARRRAMSASPEEPATQMPRAETRAHNEAKKDALREPGQVTAELRRRTDHPPVRLPAGRTPEVRSAETPRSRSAQTTSLARRSCRASCSRLEHSTDCRPADRRAGCAAPDRLTEHARSATPGTRPSSRVTAIYEVAPTARRSRSPRAR